MKTASTGPGRRATDGATAVKRVNISLTDEHRKKLKALAGLDAASVWVRKAIDKAWKESK